MSNFQAATTFINSLGRAALPSSLQSESYTEEDFNEGMMNALTEYIQATYKEPGKYVVDYDDVNKFFGTSPGFLNKFSDSGAIKTTLGTFTVTRNQDGSFTIDDTYNFNNTNEFGVDLPGGRQANMGDVFARLNPLDDRFSGLGNRLYGAARMFGGVVIPEGSPNQIPVKINIPAQEPVSNQPAQSAMSLPLPRPQLPSQPPANFSQLSTMIQNAAEQSLQQRQAANKAGSNPGQMTAFGPLSPNV